MTASPLLSTTVPEKVCFWAKLAIDIINVNSKITNLLFFILWFLIISIINRFRNRLRFSGAKIIEGSARCTSI
jgi:hypothetical protein